MRYARRIRRLPVRAVVLAALVAAAASTAAPRTIHCRYTLVVVDRTTFDAFAVCTAPYAELVLTADRAVSVRRSNPSSSPARFLRCAGTRRVVCSGSVAAGQHLAVRMTTTSLCAPIRVDFLVAAPFPNGAPLSLRARCRASGGSAPRPRR